MQPLPSARMPDRSSLYDPRVGAASKFGGFVAAGNRAGLITIATGNLDTRKKIVSAAELEMHLAQGNWLVVAGYFDPLTASVAERLGNLVQGQDERVLAIILESPDTLLSAEARSALIAALRMVQL